LILKNDLIGNYSKTIEVPMKKLVKCLFVFIACFMALPIYSQESYQGISNATPTGSKKISSIGLMAAYNFETVTNDGLLKDFGPYNNHGKFTTNHSVKGTKGKARSFMIHKDIITLPDNETLNLTGAITLAAKLKITKGGIHQHIFACNDMFVLWLTEDNKYRFADTLGQGFTTKKRVGVVERGEWHSVIATLSGGKGQALTKDNIRIFIDGQEIEGVIEKKWAPTKLAALNACVIGGTLNGGEQHQKLQFEGVLDELQIFSRAFTEDEISTYSSR
jgi:hypothetical protein